MLEGHFLNWTKSKFPNGLPQSKMSFQKCILRFNRCTVLPQTFFAKPGNCFLNLWLWILEKFAFKIRFSPRLNRAYDIVKWRRRSIRIGILHRSGTGLQFKNDIFDLKIGQEMFFFVQFQNGPRTNVFSFPTWLYYINKAFDLCKLLIIKNDNSIQQWIGVLCSSFIQRIKSIDFWRTFASEYNEDDQKQVCMYVLCLCW